MRRQMLPDDDDTYIADLLDRLCRAPRPAGSARNAELAGHLARVYADLGYATDVDAHGFTGWEQDAYPWATLSAGDQTLLADCLPVVWSGPAAGDVVGRIRAAGPVPPPVLTFGAYPWDVLPVVDDAGDEVARFLTGDPVWPQPLDGPSGIPHAMLRPADAAWADAELSAGRDVDVRLTMACRHLPDRTLRNVLARRPADPWPPRVLVSAHYDSFFTTPGAHDNASGTAALLTVARRMAATGTPPGGVGFASFDAEEWDKLGAERHAAALEAAGRLADVRLVVNIDSVGVGEQIYLLTSPGLGRPIRRALRGVAGPPVSIQEDPAFPQFDTWPFQRRGVPVIQVGTFGRRPFTQWHQPGDSLDKVGDAGRRLIADVAGVVEALVANAFME